MPLVSSHNLTSLKLSNWTNLPQRVLNRGRWFLKQNSRAEKSVLLPNIRDNKNGIKLALRNDSKYKLLSKKEKWTCWRCIWVYRLGVWVTVPRSPLLGIRIDCVEEKEGVNRRGGRKKVAFWYVIANMVSRFCSRPTTNDYYFSDPWCRWLQRKRRVLSDFLW